jgi:hypothetical protein
LKREPSGGAATLMACSSSIESLDRVLLCLSQTYWLAVDRESGDADQQ